MNWKKATKKQLAAVMQEDCHLYYQYKAAVELQRRKKMKTTRYIPEIVYWFGVGLNSKEIGEKLGISTIIVHKIIESKQLYKGRIRAEKKLYRGS